MRKIIGIDIGKKNYRGDMMECKRAKVSEKKEGYRTRK